jgi:hypothetical protein
MAKQRGLHKLQGSMDEVTYYQGKDGMVARKRGSLNKARIQNDAAFKRTRENGAEFGRAGKAVKLLRDAFRILVKQSADSKMTSRLIKEMMNVIRADASSTCGLKMSNCKKG